MAALLEMSKVHSPGSLAFITDEQALLVRVRGGWQYVQVGDSLSLFIVLTSFSRSPEIFLRKESSKETKKNFAFINFITDHL